MVRKKEVKLTSFRVKILFLSPLLFFLCIFLLAQESLLASSISPALQKLDQYILRKIEQKEIVGCAVAVVDQGQIVFMKSYGVKKKGESDKIDLNTSFQLGSASKPIAATLIAILNKQGLINLDASVKPYCSYLKPKTTLRHILTHTSGFKRVGWNNKIENGVLRDQLIKDLEMAAQEEPGTAFDYHNFVFSLMQDIVEQSQNQPMEKLLHQKLFAPLGMNQTTIGYPAFMAQENRAWPHQKNNKSKALYSSKSYSRFYHAAAFTAAGINSNIHDMAQFLIFQLVGLPGLLHPEDLQDFHTPVIEAVDAKLWLKNIFIGDFKSHYGMGWRVTETKKKRIVFHGGWVRGFCNFVSFLADKKLGIVILSNSESDFASKTSLLFLHDWVETKDKLQSR